MIVRSNQNNIFKNRLSFTSASDDTIKGVLLNRYIQNRSTSQDKDIAAFSNSLLIPESTPKNKEEIDKQNSFNYKKALKPVLITTGVALGAFLGTSLILSKYSNKLATESLEIPYDVGINFNIKEEPHFAFYRALIKPTKNNIFGFIGLCMFSGLTLTAKNFVDGSNDIWVKKQEFNTKHDYMKNMIAIDKDKFAGKLNIVNTMLKDTSDYFNGFFTKNQKGEKNVFGNFLNFKGKNKNQDDKEDNKSKKENIKNYAAFAGILASIFGIGFLMYKNYSKTLSNLQEYTKKCDHVNILNDIKDAKIMYRDGRESEATEILKNILKSTNTNKQTIIDTVKEIEIPNDVLDEIENSVTNSKMFAKPLEYLSGQSGLTNYYGYFNEERGLLYNWILHPENPFNKYLFLGFAIISSLGYVAKKAADSVKKVVVNQENKKAELDLEKKLIAVEIENFKAKKESAINPLIENFNLQAQNGKTEKELKEMAQNILTEIKTGPPYVYS